MDETPKTTMEVNKSDVNDHEEARGGQKKWEATITRGKNERGNPLKK